MEDNNNQNPKKQPCQYIQKLLNLKHKQEDVFMQINIKTILEKIKKEENLYKKHKDLDLVLCTSFAAVKLSKEFIKTKLQDINYQNTLEKILDQELLTLEFIVYWYSCNPIETFF